MNTNRRTAGIWWTLAGAIALCLSVLLVRSASLASPETGEVLSARDGSRLAVLLVDQPTAAAIRDLGGELARQGVPSVVVDVRAAQASPEVESGSVDSIVRTRLALWQRERLILVGDGRGASMVPFVANRMGADLRDRLDLIVLRGLEPRISFRHARRSGFTSTSRPTDLPVLPELERLRGRRVICFDGVGQAASAVCQRLPTGLVQLAPHGARLLGETEGYALARQVMRQLSEQVR
jgi:type IV secretory pathway VirJ component